jgi:hypothetical protein
MLPVLAGVVWAILVFCTLVPMVDAVAYLAGAGRTGTFTVTGYSTSCSSSPAGGSCWSQPVGYLEPGGATATWPDDAAVGTTFPVRLPLWNWFPGTPPLFTTAFAVITMLCCGMIQLLCWGGLGCAAYRTIPGGPFRFRRRG